MLSRPLLVFDLDGTIVDSHRDLADSTNEMLASYGVGPVSVASATAMVGDGVRRLVERALAATGLDPAEPEAVDRFAAIYARRLLVHTRPYEGLAALIGDAAALSDLAVLTNKPEAPTRQILDAFALTSAFGCIVGGDSGFARKPDPAGLTHLIAAAGTTAAATLLIGDSNVDAETARRGGAAFCAARYGFGRVDPAPRQALAPTDLPAIIRTFVGEVRSGLASGGSA
jgi:phosphoglycolate phosphatase